MAVVALFPLTGIVGEYPLFLANLVLIAAIGAMALTILTGVAGLVSMGHGALFAIGAFVPALLLERGSVPFLVAAGASLVFGGMAGLLTGLPSLRLKHFYLALSTLALHFILLYALTSYQFAGPHRNTGYGIVTADIFGLRLDSERSWFIFLACVVTLVAVIGRSWMRGKPGRAWLAIKHAEEAAAVIGVDVVRYKLLAFVLTSALVALAGTLEAYHVSRVTVEQYSLGIAITYYAMIVVGGLGSLSGAIIGATVIVTLPYVLSALTGLVPESFPGREALLTHKAFAEKSLFGLLIIGFLWLEPKGIIAWVDAAWEAIRRRLGAQVGAPGLSTTLLAPLETAEAPSRGVSTTWSQNGQAGNPLLVVEDLAVQYGRALAVSHLSLVVQEREIVAILGPNGAGKSTTLRAISGFMPAESARIVSGRVVLSGADITGRDPGYTTRAGMRLVPERSKVFVQLTVEENLRVPLGRRRNTRSEDLAFSVFPELARLRARRAGLLSGGEKQMLAITLALLAGPRLLLVDELSLGLAPWLVVDLLGRVRALNTEAGIAFLLVEQNIHEVSRIAHRLYTLNEGVIAGWQPPSAAAGDTRRAERGYLPDVRAHAEAEA